MPLLLFFVILLVLVIAHEFGHFIVAKKAGIRVDEFAFGFPPRLFAKKFGETTYSFNALPLGGYVRIYGENPDDVSDRDRKRSFIGKPRYIQALVIVAGIVFNLLLAWVLLSATLMIGISAPVDSEDGYAVTMPRLMITAVHDGAPAALGGLIAGDVIERLSDGRDSVEATTPESVSVFIGAREGRQITLDYLRKGEHKEVIMTPVSGISPTGGAIGIYMDMVGTLKLPIHKALYAGAIKTYQYTQMTAVGTYSFILAAIVGHADFTQVSGPIGIVHAVVEAAGLGIANLLLFTASISVSLAVFNILPFPGLDGGRFLFIVIEAITRKPIPPKVANAFNLGCLALLMLLLIVVSYHDVLKYYLK